ncbi:MAG: ammonium transporter [Candidatus Hydrothermarchaeaceae archaeon]
MKVSYMIGIMLVLLMVAPVYAQEGAEESPWLTEATPEEAITFIWLLLTGGFVFLMQAGFSMLEAGFSRAKNTVNILMKNLMDFSVGILAFWAVGFGIMWGAKSNLFFGYSDFFLKGFDAAGYNGWFFQMVFAATAATIVSGAMAERTKFKAYLIYTVIVTAIIYPVYNHWVWSGNGIFWADAPTFITGLFGVDGHDFAGSGVVHGVGGYVALAGAIVLGPRIGKFVNGKPVAIPGHSMSMAMLGAFILAFGWLGFNGGSTLNGLDINYNLVIVNTFLAAGAGAVMAMSLTWLKGGKPDAAFSINGLIAGLVAITAPAGSVDPWAAVVIGAIGGAVVYFGYRFNENVLKVDDPIGAIACHGYSGTWGLISVGIFSNGVQKIYAANAPGLLYGGTALFGVQVAMALFNFVWAFGAGYIMFKAIDAVVGLRVSPEEEMQGLDMSEHGMSAYPELTATSQVNSGE